MLFVLVMECLNAMIHKADAWGLLQAPGTNIKHRTSLYTDDVVLFLAPVEQDLMVAKEILFCFENASGFSTNYSKSQVFLINCTKEHVSLIMNILQCQISDFPCTYLGVPLSVHKLPKSSLQPLVDKVVRHLPLGKGGSSTRVDV